MLQRILVSLLTYLMAFYPIFGSLANAGAKEEIIKPSPLVGEEKGEGSIDESTKVKLQETYGKLPLSFIQNNGQVDEKVKYYEKGNGHATFFTKEGVYLSLVRSQRTEDRRQKEIQNIKSDIPNPQSEIVKLIPLNANKNPQILAQDKQEGKVNYFIGNDPNKWKTNIPTHGAVIYKDIYKNIDMKFYGNNKQMEYDIIVKPGADPNMVKLSYEGIEGLKVTKEGDLLISLKEGSIIQKKPYIYQDINGKKIEVDGRFEILSQSQDPSLQSPVAYGFQIASYNKNHPLIIDPALAYSTYLGGSGDDYGYGIAVDTSGNAYVTGGTGSTNFPMALPIQGANAGGSDVFIAKINAVGTSLVYSTYMGGSSTDYGYGIAVDASGNAYVTGFTYSANFPLSSPIYGTLNGYSDAFVAKLNSSGTALVYSTYLGGSMDEYGYGIAVDTSGNTYVAGLTGSTDFPLVSPIQGSNAGLGHADAFITKLNSSGNALIYSTYLGGSSDDYSTGIAVDSSGNTYVTGVTGSTNFPIVSPIQGANAGGSDAFVAKLNYSGTALVYSTYLGGSSSEVGYGIAVDSSGNAYVTGYTNSTNFPTASPLQGSNAGGSDAFVTKISASGTSLVYSTYIGGGDGDSGRGIAVDTSGNAYITGGTGSTNFPIVSPIQGSNAGYDDVFVTKINPSGSVLIYSTYLGGNSNDYGNGIAVDTSGNTYTTGYTGSINFPTASPIQGANAGGSDAFIAKIVAHDISGCILVKGSPVTGASVVLKQKREADQTTTTNTSGCYYFDKAVSGKSFQVIIDGPVVP